MWNVSVDVFIKFIYYLFVSHSQHAVLYTFLFRQIISALQRAVNRPLAKTLNIAFCYTDQGMLRGGGDVSKLTANYYYEYHIHQDVVTLTFQPLSLPPNSPPFIERTLVTSIYHYRWQLLF